MRQLRYSTKKSRAKFRREVLARDGRCLMCGSLFNLDPDHITGRVSKIDDVREAGATICRKCHSLKTDGKIKWKESQLPKECIEWIIFRKWEGWEGIEWDISGTSN